MSTVTVDQSGRLQLPNCAPGDAFEITSSNPGLIILRKLGSDRANIEVPIMRLERRGRLLVIADPPPGPIDFGSLMRQQRDDE